MTTFHKIVYLLLVLSVCVFSEENSTEILSEQQSDVQQEWQKYFAQQTVSGLDNVILTGPILSLDTKTLFIPNVRYDGTNSTGLNFYIVPKTLEEKITIANENNETNKFHAYYNDNIYLKLPNEWQTDNVKEFGVWYENENKVLAKVSMNTTSFGLKEADGFDKTTQDGKLILRVPKCCRFDEQIVPGGCLEGASTFQPQFQVLTSNATHLDDNPNNTAPYIFVPYISYPSCSKKVPFDVTEDVKFLINTSVVIRTEELIGVLQHDRQCLDSLNNENFLFVCYDQTTTAEMPSWIFVTLTSISTVCFAFTAIWYWFVLQVKDIHKQCFVFYSVFMCLTFLFLIIFQFTSSGCNILGGFFIFFLMEAYLWLLVICIDLKYIVCTFNERNVSLKRISTYFLGTTVLAALITIISVYDGTADVPYSFIKLDGDTCNFDSNIYLFFIPLALIILSCFVLLILIRYDIYSNDKNNSVNYFWIKSQSNFKFMWRQTCVMFALIFLFTLLHLVSNIFDESFDVFALDILSYLQGLFTMISVLVHGYCEAYNAQNNAMHETEMANFLYRSYIIFWLIMFLWVLRGYLNVFLPTHMIDVFKILESLQGVITIAIFIASKHGLQQTRQAFKRKKKKKPIISHEELIQITK